MRHAPLAVFLALILFGALAGVARNAAWHQEKADDLDHVATLAAASVKHVMEAHVLATEMITSTVRHRPEVLRDIDALAAEVLASFPAGTSLQFSPTGKATRAYSRGIRDEAIARGPGLEAPELAALEGGGSTVNAPALGGESVTVTQALFLPDGQGERFWGLISAVVRLADLVRMSDVGGIAGHGYVYQLSVPGPRTGAEAAFAMPEGTLSRDIEVANARLRLSVAFAAPQEYAPLIWIDAVVAFALATLLAYLVHGVVSQRRMLQGRVVATSAQLKAVMDSIPDYIFMKDHDGVYMGCNKAYEARVGRAERDVVGHTDAEFYPAEEAAFYRAKDREMLASGKPMRIEESVLQADGTVRWFDTVKTPFWSPSGRILGMVGICRDMTEHKRAEQALRLSEAVFQATSEGIVITGPDTRIQRVNGGFTRITGYSAEEAVGRTPRLLASGRQDASFYARMWAELERDGQWQGEIWNRRKGGEIYPQMVCINAVRNGENRVEHYVAVFSDITVRKQAEMALQEADRRKDEFLAMLAHELRNPLGPLRNAAELLRRMPQADAMLQRIARIMERQTAQATRLIEDLLDISRISLGKVDLQVHRVELSGLVDRALETARPLLDARGHHLVMRGPGEHVWLDADDVRIVQVITNLLNNAAKYTQPGGLVVLAWRADGDQAVIDVQDNGDGIEPALLPHVFELFRQGERNRSRPDAGGLGVGLALVGRLVAMHGGRVDARSEGAGCGSCFEVRLPLSVAPVAA